MLIEFTTTNYRSFKDTLTFSMCPAPKQKGLDYSIMSEKAGARTYKALSSAVIYGPNASGKTNIIGAMDTFRSIVIRGHINNSEEVETPNIAASQLELIPFSGLDKAEPISFGVKFIEKGIYIEYNLKLDLGLFMNQNHDRTVLSENLCVNGKEVFVRVGQKLNFGARSSVRRYLNKGALKNWSSITEIANSGLSKKELFLSNGFKSIVSVELASAIIDWFTNKFMVIYRANSMSFVRKFVNQNEGEVLIDSTMNKAAKIFGVTSNALGYRHTEQGKNSILCSLIEQNGERIAIPAAAFESYGTVRFVNEFPLVIRALRTGATLIMDEFDASIHPMALMNIIAIFHNDEINTKHAQLIFNTHNPIFLSADLYRRDEIKFVERDDETQVSTHYSLSDFKTTGKSGVRKRGDYMKNYFVNQYGAIKDVDFSELFETDTSNEEGVQR